MNISDKIKFDEKGLVPVIAQNSDGTVLMLAWANAEAIEETERTGFATYFSRSRQKLWRKGEESGNRQKVLSIDLDCDGDCLIYKVEQSGAGACHTGHFSCFYRTWKQGEWVENSPVIKDPAQMYKNPHK